MKYEWTADVPGWKLSDGEIDWSVMSDSKSKPSPADEIAALIARLKELEHFRVGLAELAAREKPDPKLTARDQAMARALTFSGDYDCRALWLLY